MHLKKASHARLRIWAILFSLTAGVIIMIGKFYAYKLTQSAAILSDAMESIINVIAGSAALGSLILSAKPPDPSHPYGHARVEYFSAGLEGGLIIFAAVEIFQAGWPRIFEPRELPRLEMGLLLVCSASVLNLVVGICLAHIGKKTHSIVLVADGKHIMTDVYTSLGIIGGLILARLTGCAMLDGVIAVAMAAMILITGLRLLRQAIAGLMDEADPSLIREITSILKKHRKDAWIDIHRLRAWRSGSIIRIDFHIVLSRELSLQEASEEIEHLREILDAHFLGLVDVMIHSDPCVEHHCPGCGLNDCIARRKPLLFQFLWSPEKLTSGIRAAGLKAI